MAGRLANEIAVFVVELAGRYAQLRELLGKSLVVSRANNHGFDNAIGANNKHGWYCINAVLHRCYALLIVSFCRIKSECERVFGASILLDPGVEWRLLIEHIEAEHHNILVFDLVVDLF